MLHNQVIHNLRTKLNKPKVTTIIDQFATESKYYEYIKFTKSIERDITFETKAESKYPSVAVSSIIARYSFITKMAKLSRELNMEIPMGASTRVDKFAAEVIKKYGEEKLQEVAKIHFQNTKRAKQ